jgi:hypothetical protein
MIASNEAQASMASQEGADWEMFDRLLMLRAEIRTTFLLMQMQDELIGEIDESVPATRELCSKLDTMCRIARQHSDWIDEYAGHLRKVHRRVTELNVAAEDVAF